MPARLHPGVYVEEVPGGARAIESVGTSTAIFVGETERGPIAPTNIKSLGEFERLFGGHLRQEVALGGAISTHRLVLRYAVEAFFQNGGTSAYVLRLFNTDADSLAEAPSAVGASLLIASSPGAWAKRVSVFYLPSSDQDATRFRLVVLYRAPGAAPTDYQIFENWDRLSTKPGDENYMPDVLMRSQFVRASVSGEFPRPSTTADAAFTTDRAMVLAASSHGLDGTEVGDDGETQVALGTYGSELARLDEVTDASLLVVPAPFGTADPAVATLAGAAFAYVEGRAKQDLFCIADLPRAAGRSATDFTTAARAAIAGLSTATSFGAAYGPWVEASDPVGIGRDPTIFLGPSGFVAGLYARIDQRRGVWKAPAGLDASLLGARQPEYKLLDAHQDNLNPVGANAIRIMPGGGNVVWGARTLKPASEWRYIPVRRTAIFLRMSLYNSIQWAVFEPNDQTLWNSLRLSVSAFMDQLFRQGAFAGATSREAYFVKCDADTTNEDDRAAGIVNVLVGFAPVRPAEFVIVKLSQITSQKS